jgi:ribose-phosphate pyrophosphokinase
MILFALKNYEAMAAELEQMLPWLRHGKFQLARYDNGELHASVYTPVAFEHCVVLGSITPPDEQLLSTLLLAHTLRKEGAAKLSAVLPYLAYSRQDQDKPGEGLAVALVGRLLATAGFDQVITADVHSDADKQLFAIPIISLNTAQLFADAVKKYGLTDATFVAPDNGAIARCKAVKAAAGIPGSDTPYFEKQRIGTGIVHVGPIGNVGSRAVIIDDMLDTGTTLVSACQKLVEAGVREIYIMITHGLFTGEHWKRLWSLGVKRIICTETVPLPAGLDRSNIETLSIVPLLRQQLLLGEDRTLLGATRSALDSVTEVVR